MITISKDSTFTLNKIRTSEYELYVNDQLLVLDKYYLPVTMVNILNLLEYYKNRSIKEKQLFYVEIEKILDYFEVHSGYLFNEFIEGFDEHMPSNKFSFLWFHPQFERVIEFASNWVVFFKTSDYELEKFQLIYISIPKKSTVLFTANFQVIQDGKMIYLTEKELHTPEKFPEWFYELAIKTKKINEKIHRIRQLFANKR